MTAEKELGIHDFDENLNEQSLLKQLMPKTRNITLEPTRETITVPLERNIVERSFFGELDQLEKEQSIRNFSLYGRYGCGQKPTPCWCVKPLR